MHVYLFINLLILLLFCSHRDSGWQQEPCYIWSGVGRSLVSGLYDERWGGLLHQGLYQNTGHANLTMYSLLSLHTVRTHTGHLKITS